jgi:hypothetical protein
VSAKAQEESHERLEERSQRVVESDTTLRHDFERHDVWQIVQLVLMFVVFGSLYIFAYGRSSIVCVHLQSTVP